MGTISLPSSEHPLGARAIVHGAQSRCARQRRCWEPATTQLVGEGTPMRLLCAPQVRFEDVHRSD